VRAFIVIDDLKPIGKQTGTKISRAGGHSTEAYQDFKTTVGWEAKLQLRKLPAFRFLPVPRPRPVIIAVAIYWPNFPRGHRQHIGDVADNGISGILDAMKGIVYDDDDQIMVSLAVRIKNTTLRRIKICLDIPG
jgi:hypothetical protein